MNADRNVGQAIKNLSNQFRRYMTTRRQEWAPDMDEFDRVTDIQGRIISYLYEKSEDEAVYQRDLEKHFNIRRSTATNILGRIERNGLIRRKKSENDARMKTIILTGKAKRLYPRAREEIQKAERQAAKGLTEVEMALFFRIVERMSQNMTHTRG